MTNKGLLIPRIDLQNLTDVTTITTPTTSLLVYNTGATLSPSGYYYWSGSAWVPFLTNSAATNAGWSLLGNAGTNAAANFIGTTDAVDWVVKTSGTERMRVLANANVGIGTASPVGEFHFHRAAGHFVIQTATFHGSPATTYDNVDIFGALYANNENAGISIHAQSIEDYARWSGRFALKSSGSGVPRTAIDMITRDGSNAITSNVEAISIIEDGNVGIGTVNPTRKLQIYYNVDNSGETNPRNIDGIVIHNDNTTVGSYTALNFSTPGSSSGLGARRVDGNNVDLFLFSEAAGNSEKVTFKSDGNVGIGTTTPAVKLHLNDAASSMGSFPLNTSSSILKIQEATGSLYLDGNTIASDIANGFFIGNTSNGPIVFGTNNTSRVWIENNGNVGVGTGFPGAILHVSGAVADRVLLDNGMILSSKNAAGTVRNLLTHYSDDVVYLDNPDGDIVLRPTGGNVGIGTTAPSETLDVNGTARIRSIGSAAGSPLYYVAGTGVLSTSASDIRLKQDITTMSSTLNKVMKLRSVIYNWKSNPNNPTKDCGFIAQEVETIFPEVVFTNPNDGYMGINYDRFISILTKTIQEQQFQIERLNTQNEILQKENQEIKAENKEQKENFESRISKIEAVLNQQGKK